jgi:hypothetical protein
MSNILQTLKVPERKSQTKYKAYLKKRKKENTRHFGSIWNLSWHHWLIFFVVAAFYITISSVTFWEYIISKLPRFVSHSEL